MLEREVDDRERRSVVRLENLAVRSGHDVRGQIQIGNDDVQVTHLEAVSDPELSRLVRLVAPVCATGLVTRSGAVGLGGRPCFVVTRLRFVVPVARTAGNSDRSTTDQRQVRSTVDAVHSRYRSRRGKYSG